MSKQHDGSDSAKHIMTGNVTTQRKRKQTSNLVAILAISCVLIICLVGLLYWAQTPSVEFYGTDEYNYDEGMRRSDFSEGELALVHELFDSGSFDSTLNTRLRAEGLPEYAEERPRHAMTVKLVDDEIHGEDIFIVYQMPVFAERTIDITSFSNESDRFGDYVGPRNERALEIIQAMLAEHVERYKIFESAQNEDSNFPPTQDQ